MEAPQFDSGTYQGYILDLIPDSWTQLNRKVRNSVRKASRELYVREGSLDELRSLHWNPSYLPLGMSSSQRIFVTVLDDSLPPISAIMVEEKGDHIVYRYAGNDPMYKSYQGNTFLLWHVAEYYQMKGFRYFDLGGSRKPGIASFKRRFGTRTYPLQSKKTITARLKYRLTRWLPNMINEAIKCSIPSITKKL